MKLYSFIRLATFYPFVHINRGYRIAFLYILRKPRNIGQVYDDPCSIFTAIHKKVSQTLFQRILGDNKNFSLKPFYYTKIEFEFIPKALEICIPLFIHFRQLILQNIK